MNLNILKELHKDLEKLIVDKYVKKYNISLSSIYIDHLSTKINFNREDKKNKFIQQEEVKFSNIDWGKE